MSKDEDLAPLTSKSRGIGLVSGSNFDYLLDIGSI